MNSMTSSWRQDAVVAPDELRDRCEVVDVDGGQQACGGEVNRLDDEDLRPRLAVSTDMVTARRRPAATCKLFYRAFAERSGNLVIQLLDFFPYGNEVYGLPGCKSGT